MTETVKTDEVLAEGTLSFTVESRILRELGERLVKQPEVALVELVKNAYDADATLCEVVVSADEILVKDNGAGMTLDDFKFGWMRIGTHSKELHRESKVFGRAITGEKGIGRFAVRFLGSGLELRSVANDEQRGLTVLKASFDWPSLDHIEDLGDVKVPYTLSRAAAEDIPGTSLEIRDLRPAASKVNLDSVRSASIAVVTPFASLLSGDQVVPDPNQGKREERAADPGFSVRIRPGTEEGVDVAKSVLENAVLRATLQVENDRLELQIYRRGKKDPALTVRDEYHNNLGRLRADIRFFPKRKGTFSGLSVDGQVAQRWVRSHAGVAVFDRKFRVLPYGSPTDDWLKLAADVSTRHRRPRSSLANKYFPMDDATRGSTKLNYMLRLPHREQLIGIVQVEGRRTLDHRRSDSGLIAAADREGFLQNEALEQLFDVVRGAVEAIASIDREVQLEQERDKRQATLERLRTETQEAIHEIEQNPNIRSDDKARIVDRLTLTQSLAEQFEQRTKEQEQTLEVMSLLGVVAGFMTHEFGMALTQLEKSQRSLVQVGKRDPIAREAAASIADRIEALRDFVLYSRAYIRGAVSPPSERFPAKPRIKQVIRIFGKYAADRGIDVKPEVGTDILAPRVPLSLYSGVVLNLYTNALKSVTAKMGNEDRRILLKAWEESDWHYLVVSDTGIGIPTALRKRVFDPLFTTTADNRDPLGSGMGLGLSLVKRSVESYGGRVDVLDPPPGFSTSVRVKFPLSEK